MVYSEREFELMKKYYESKLKELEKAKNQQDIKLENRQHQLCQTLAGVQNVLIAWIYVVKWLIL